MDQNSSTDFLFLSDLHLSLGANPLTSARHPEEAFLHDAEFAHFLEYHQERAVREGRDLRLVLLGDIFDFRQIQDAPGRWQMGISPPNTLIKLDQIAAGHPLFFQALANLLAQGYSIDVIPGNHDIELVFLPVQAHLRQLICPAGESQGRGKVNFFPWFYYQPGLFYAEHGQQWQGFNVFPNLLQTAQDQRADQLQLPYGYAFDHLLYDFVRAVSPDLQNGIGLRAARAGLRRRPTRLIATLPLFARTVALLAHGWLLRIRSWNRTASAASADNAASAAAAQALEFYANLMNLPPTALADLTRLLPTSIFQTTHSLLRKILGSLGFGRPSHFLYHAAQKIHAVLLKDGAQVPFYIFGHDHHPGKFPLNPSTQGYYLNCGTWARHSRTHANDQPNGLPYVEVRADMPADQRSANVYWWHEPPLLGL